ncbi:hypothetical protein [Bacillus tuaregi]|uniref:hypothetical protein n=1 Tax=Bacillus tuaregi TaxID=1816695 RepID=UPI0008F9140C|nr:hypothetical protein [Bacillus tuaregi]
MWGITGILFIGIAVSSYEVPRLVKRKYWRDLIVFSIFMSVGITLNILLNLNVEIPNPTNILLKICTPIHTFIDGILS